MMKQSFFKGKKGTAAFFVIIELLILLLAFGIIILFLTFFFNTFIDQFQLAGACTTGSCASTIAKFQKAFTYWDTGTFLLVIGAIIGIGYGSLKIASKSIMYLLFLIESAILGLVSYYFSFLYVTYVTFEVFQTTALLFPKTIVLLSNLHWIALIMMSVATLTYFKRDNEDMGSGPRMV